jgi:hydroxymethylpyrimidine/phosphomethylpyrimidine kinase
MSFGKNQTFRVDLPDMRTLPVVLSIAGFDPSSGAGVTADLKTAAAHHCYGLACITALTVQSTQGVRRVEPLAEALVQETLDELIADFEIAAVHIGMLATQGIVQVVSDFVASHELKNVVLDPVIRSTSGADLLEKAAIKLVVEKLIPLATVITPNIDEAAALTGLPVRNVEQMRTAAEELHRVGAKAVVITGGHLDPAIDLLSYPGETGIQQEQFEGPHQRSKSTHGTGCAFATALACELALGRGLREAVPRAKAYVEGAIAHAYAIGKGAGPVHHLFGFETF